MKRLAVSLLVLGMVPGFAFSEDQEEAKQNAGFIPASVMSIDGHVKGFVPFVGMGMGYMDRSNRYETEGVPSDIRLLGSYYFSEKPYIVDLGLGLRHQSYSQKIGGKETTSGNLEAAVRYQLQDKWSVGGVYQVMAGKGKHVGARTENAQFIGLQAMKEIPVKLDFPSVLRVGGRFMTDVNVSKEQVNYAMVEVALGFPEVQTVARQEFGVAPARPVAKIIPQKIIVREELRTEAEKSRFAIDSSAIAMSQKSYLQKFGIGLAKNPQVVGRIHVVGHADDTGTPQHNMHLSKMRAQAVVAELMAAGVPADMISIDWKGETMPLVVGTSESERSQNRRVEIQFVDVQDPQGLSQIIP